LGKVWLVGRLETSPADDATAERWRRTALALESSGTSIALARRFAAAFVAGARDEHGVAVCPRGLDTVQLVVSELVTNARKYAPGPLLLELRLAEDFVEVDVWDSNPRLPEVQPSDPERVGRHGLEIVLAVSHSFHVQSRTVGKSITARIALTEQPHSQQTVAFTPRLRQADQGPVQ
jgi:hypothetical protein